MYILKTEKANYGFGETEIYNVYFKTRKEETFDCTFGSNKEKAEKYVKNMNEGI